MADGYGYFGGPQDIAPEIPPDLNAPHSDGQAQHDAWVIENERRWDMDIGELFVDPPSTPHVPSPTTSSPYFSIAVPVLSASRTLLFGREATFISPPAPPTPTVNSPRPGNQAAPNLGHTVRSSPSPRSRQASLASSTASTKASTEASNDGGNSATSSSFPPPTLSQPAAKRLNMDPLANAADSSAVEQSPDVFPFPQASPSSEASSSPEASSSQVVAGPSTAPPAQALPGPVGMQFPVDDSATYYTATFPPGRDRLDFVPFGQRGKASIHQGNDWPITLEMRCQIIRGETDANKLRPKQQRLTYKQVLAKYDTWTVDDRVKESTMRFHNRKFTNPVRDRVPKFHRDHLQALRRAVAASRDAKGRVVWNRVRVAVHEDTNRLFGPATLGKRWRKMVQDGRGEDYDGSDASHSDGGEDEDEED